jgi:hypothetical protein
VGSRKFLVFTKQSPGPSPSLLLPLNPLCPLQITVVHLLLSVLPRVVFSMPMIPFPSLLSCPTRATASPEHPPAATSLPPRKAHRGALDLYLSCAPALHKPLHSVSSVPLPILEHPTQIPLPPFFFRSGKNQHCRGRLLFLTRARRPPVALQLQPESCL